MADNGFSASDAVLTSAMSGGFGRGGYGGGWGGGYGAPFADFGSNAIRINSGNRANAAGIENLLDQNQFSATNKNIVDGDARICDKLMDNANRGADQSFQSELRSGDRLRDVERLIIDGQKEAAKCCCDAKLEALKCCCETQKLITAEASATRELINQNTIRAAVDQNNISATVGGINAQANANTNAIIQAIHGIPCPT